MEVLWRDIRIALRMLVKNRGLTTAAVVILGLGIGANTAIFSLVDNVLFRTLPVRQPSELMNIGRRATAKELAGSGLSWPMYLEYRDHCANTFEGLAAYYDRAQVTLSQSGASDLPAAAALVTGNYFDLLGVRAARGRAITPDDDLAGHQNFVAVVSYGFWKESLGKRPDIVGSTVRINDGSYRIIGVAPQGFFGIGLDSIPDVWLPMSSATNVSPLLHTQMGVIENPFFRVFGRLKPGVSLAQARQQFEAIGNHLDAGKTIKVALAVREGRPQRFDTWEKPATAIDPADATSGVRSKDQMLLILGAAALLLLLVMSDLASLLLARVERRRREMAVRLAMGASRWQIARAFVVESLLVSCFGAVAGIFMANWIVRLLGAAISAEGGLTLARTESILDLRVLVFSAVVALLAGLAIGAAPAFQAGRSDVLAVIGSETPASRTGRPRAMLRGALTVFQIAASVLLVCAALLFLKSYWVASRVRLAFSPNRILMVMPHLQGFKTDDAERAFLFDLLEAARAVPGVRAAAIGSPAPLGWSVGMPTGTYYKARITPGYFAVLGMSIIRGRDFTTQDVPGAPYVAIVNQTMANEFWPDKDPIGQTVRHVLEEDRTVQIVGVVPDTRKAGVGDPEDAILYVPLDQFYSAYPYKLPSTLVALGDDHPGRLYRGILSASIRLDKNVTLPFVQTAADFLAVRSNQPRFKTELIGTFAIFALILAAAGLYGLVSYVTAARTREFGVRLALGASRSNILRMVLRGAVLRGLAGIALGFALEIALMRFLSGFVRGVTVTDFPTFGVVALLMLFVVVSAAFVPAFRASQLDPIETLRDS